MESGSRLTGEEESDGPFTYSAAKVMVAFGMINFYLNLSCVVF